MHLAPEARGPNDDVGDLIDRHDRKRT
jgi:hypothetical protein